MQTVIPLVSHPVKVYYSAANLTPSGNSSVGKVKAQVLFAQGRAAGKQTFLQKLWSPFQGLRKKIQTFFRSIVDRVKKLFGLGKPRLAVPIAPQQPQETTLGPLPNITRTVAKPAAVAAASQSPARSTGSSAASQSPARSTGSSAASSGAFIEPYYYCFRCGAPGYFGMCPTCDNT